MCNSVVISGCALAISAVSLLLSLYLAERDRSKIQAESFAHPHERTGEYSSITVRATNVGRRSVKLLFLSGKYEDGRYAKQYISEDGVCLQEGDVFKKEFGKFDGIMITSEEDSPASQLVNIWIEDSTGKKHKIKDAYKNIALIRESKHPFGVKTHG